MCPFVKVDLHGYVSRFLELSHNGAIAVIMKGLELLKEFYQDGMLVVIQANALTFMAYAATTSFGPCAMLLSLPGQVFSYSSSFSFQ